MAEQEPEGKLRRDLGWPTATSLVVGCVIGAGVFFKPYAIYQVTGGAPGMGMLAWVLGGLVSILAALTFAEVAILIPKTGGIVTHLTEAFDERLGFLAGWMQVVIFYPSFLAGYGVKVGSELAEYVGPQFELPIAIAVIVALVAVNAMGSRAAGGMQVLATICKLIPLALLMVFGFLWGSGGHPVVSPLVAPGLSVPGTLGSTLLAVLFAFEGWTNVGTIAGEMRDPGRDLPRAIVGGVSIIMAVYLAINVAYLWVIPASELMNLESPAAAVATKLFGPSGGTFIKLGIIVSVIGAGNGFLMSGSRVAYQLADLCLRHAPAHHPPRVGAQLPRAPLPSGTDPSYLERPLCHCQPAAVFGPPRPDHEPVQHCHHPYGPAGLLRHAKGRRPPLAHGALRSNLKTPLASRTGCVRDAIFKLALSLHP